MAKKNVQSINDVVNFLTKDKFLPIFFLCGEDSYAIEQCVDLIEKAAQPLIESDFDKEIVNAEKSTELTQIFDFALSFPFGSGKKLLILKNFDKINEKSDLISYINNPAEFTILVITQPSKVQDYSRAPYSSLVEKNFLFEAKPLKGDELVNWFLRSAKKLGLSISEDNAKAVVEIVGEDKAMLEMQLQKFINYTSKETTITFEAIKSLSSPTKEFSIFDLLDTLGKGDKASSLKIGLNLLDAGVEMVYIINMVAKFILTVAQIYDISKQRLNDYEAAKQIGASYYFYINCKKASYFMSDERLYNASKALLNADLSVKTTSLDSRTIIQMLIAKLIGNAITAPFQG